ncbi:MAG: hypothetical protein K2G45_05840 [Lachnospiraceae bacterium]|nr:hypothetical protein [Lachnospiraceae bacterium]
MKVNTNIHLDYNMKYGTVNRQESDSKATTSENKKNLSEGCNVMNLDKNHFATFFGASRESQYGYAAEFDSVSRAYAQAISSHDYKTAGEMDVISAMDAKYLELKADIDDKYSGDEKNARLSELDADYKFIIDSNIISSTDLALKNESAVNKLRNAFAKAYERAKGLKSDEFIQNAYGSLANWSGICEETEEQLSSYKILFEKLKDAVQNSFDMAGAGSYADSLLKTINFGLAGISEKNAQVGKGIYDKGSQEMKELWDLIENKSRMYFANDKIYNSDEEKYKAFLKDSAQAGSIDTRLSELLAVISEK